MDNIDFYKGAVWYVVFIISLTFHEAAHAWAALKLGDLTAYLGGQVTLDPIPHIRREPVGTIVVPILSFALAGWMIGWASAPYNREWADRYPKRAAWMAAAGPAANFLLVLFAALLMRIGVGADVFNAPSMSSYHFTSVVTATSADSIWPNAAFMLSVLFSLNLILMIFNLIPLPPMDGGSVITLFMSDRAARSFQDFFREPWFSLLGLVVAWKLFPSVFFPVLAICVRFLCGGTA